MDLYLIYKRTDKGKWKIADYHHGSYEAAAIKGEKVEYQDRQTWNSNRIIHHFDKEIYVPTFEYQLRKIVK